MLDITAICAQAMNAINEQNQLKKIMQSDLPQETKDLIMKQNRKAHHRAAKQARKLQVAREGRSLNFWGNR